MSEPLTKDEIVAGLTAQADGLRGQIAKYQTVRADANERIRVARAELVDVERMLGASRPRPRKRGGAQ